VAVSIVAWLVVVWAVIGGWLIVAAAWPRADGGR
jgi:hypothetical protein